MEKIRREIRLFFVYYGKLFAVIIGIICLVIFIIQSLNSFVIEQEKDKYSSEEYLNEEQKRKEVAEDITYISQFIEYCNEGKTEMAYAMLSEKFKEEKYGTIEEFEEEYINKVFNISICEYQIINNLDTYKIILTQDMLITGSANSKIEQEYKIINLLERKIYICD